MISKIVMCYYFQVQKHIRLKVGIPVLVLVSSLMGGVVYDAWKHANEAMANAPLNARPVIINEESHKDAAVVDKRLKNIIEKWAETNDGSAGIIVREIGGDNRFAGYREDAEFVTASTYKLFLSYVLLNEIQDGNLSLNTQTSIGKPLAECFESLLIYSEDLCAYPMGQLVGWDKVDALIKEQGFEHTSIDNYDQYGNFIGSKQTEPRDEAEFMYRLASGELLDEKWSAYLLDKLENQVWKERVPAGIPDGIKVASKPGWLEGYQNSAAIVYGPKTTYVIVVMTNNSSVEAIADVSKQVYDYLNPS